MDVSSLLAMQSKSIYSVSFPEHPHRGAMLKKCVHKSGAPAGLTPTCLQGDRANRLGNRLVPDMATKNIVPGRHGVVLRLTDGGVNF